MTGTKIYDQAVKFLVLLLSIFIIGIGAKNASAEVGIEFNGALEVEAYFQSVNNVDSSDITLATATLGAEATLNDDVSGTLVFLWEEDDTEQVVVDEGYITITSSKMPSGLSITAGRVYIPFGNFASNFITDPLTLTLGETAETVVMASFEADKFEASAGFFNGATTVIGEDDSIDNYFASVTVNVMEGVKVGGSYISDITDTDLEIVGPNPVDTVAGYSVFAEVVYAGVVLNLEYLAASQFDVADLDLDNGGVGDGTGDAPATYNVEVGYELSDKVTVAARYEGSSEFFGFQETQYGVAGSYALYDNVGLTAEFISGENYLGEENSGFGAQLAIEF